MFCSGEAESLVMVDQRTLAAQHQYVMNRASNVGASAGGGSGGGELQVPGSIPAAEVFRLYSNGNSVNNCGATLGVLPPHDNNCTGPQNPCPNPQNPISSLQNPHFNRQNDCLNSESPQSNPGGNSQNPCSNPAENVKVERVFLYKECQRNHAVSIGGHALDGCGEFMASEEDAFKCAACNCHRNFHRRELEGEESERPCRFCKETNKSGGTGIGPYYPPPPVLPHTSSSAHILMGFSPGLGESDDLDTHNNSKNPSNYHHRSMKKRFRTKFSQNQKERMYMFADKIGWRMQKQDEAAVQQFCNEIGVSKGVLKVWMHNNKHTLGKKH